MSSKEELLIKEFRASGFVLERQVAEVFRKNHFNVTPNRLLETEVETLQRDRLAEVDVYAESIYRPTHTDAYVVECKGSPSVDYLVLIPDTEGMPLIPNVQFSKGKVYVTSNLSTHCKADDRSLPVLCHSGDFFAASEEKGKLRYKKASTQDERNQIFKGVTQLHAALDGVYSENTTDDLRVHPLLVTNASIQVVSYQPNDEIQLRGVPWAAYTFPLVYKKSTLSYAEWTATKLPECEIYAQQKRFPVVWVVNVNFLENFLASPGRAYKGIDLTKLKITD